MTRANHWIKPNHQCRIPKRWVAFDTESITRVEGDEQIQSWGLGAAIRWRRDLAYGDAREDMVFDDPVDMWSWVSDFCRPGYRTVGTCHNLGYDARIARVFDILPDLGFNLEWCNLSNSVSTMTWRSDHGTLVLCDLFTWVPKELRKIGFMLGLPKLRMPPIDAPKQQWDRYCLRDAEIVYRATRELVDYVGKEQLGNWQPTGAGMAYATWRHKFMSHKVLVHDNEDVLKDERAAMHTGRAEAWRHGEVFGDKWFEVDLRSAYTRISAGGDLPSKYKFSCGRLVSHAYGELKRQYRILCQVDVTTGIPVVPYYTGDRTIWPIGSFNTWLWDCEIDELIKEGQAVHIVKAHFYTKAPVLGDWARYTLRVAGGTDNEIPETVRAWHKHAGRALIGRLALRIPSWELYGANPQNEPGLSYDVDGTTGETRRMMHVGDKTFVETARSEGRDSLPQITGWIMAKCRANLWRAMVIAGLDNIAHVDTDSIITNAAGLSNLRKHWNTSFDDVWQVKSTWSRLTVYGPRNIRVGRDRKVSGVPRKATEVRPNVFVGERWRGLATDLSLGRPGNVTVESAEWALKRGDPRRLSAASGGGRTVPITVSLSDRDREA